MGRRNVRATGSHQADCAARLGSKQLPPTLQGQALDPSRPPSPRPGGPGAGGHHAAPYGNANAHRHDPHLPTAETS
eukprot:1747378-Heterocapsa_arctica.AAC.1